MNALTFDPSSTQLKFEASCSYCHLRLGTSEGSSEESIFRALNSTAKVQFTLLNFLSIKPHTPFRSSEFSNAHLLSRSCK